MEQSFLHFLTIWPPLGYIMAFLAMIIEGDGPLFVFGFLAYEGFFNPVLLALCLYAGTVTGDALWYGLGVLTHHHFPRVKKWADRIATPFDGHLHNHPFRTIFLSQFVYGIHHAIWVRAGSLKIPLKYLVKIDLFASIFWVLIIGGLGYGSSATIFPIGKYIKYGELALLIGLILFLFIQHYITKIAEKKL